MSESIGSFSDLDEVAQIVWDATRTQRSAVLHQGGRACTPEMAKACCPACVRWVTRSSIDLARRNPVTPAGRPAWRARVRQEARATRIAARGPRPGTAPSLEAQVLDAAMAASRGSRVTYPVAVRRAASTCGITPEEAHQVLVAIARRVRTAGGGCALAA